MRYAPIVLTFAAALAFGAIGWQIRAEYAAWQGVKTLLPQIVQLLNAHEAVLKTQPPAPPPK